MKVRNSKEIIFKAGFEKYVMEEAKDVQPVSRVVKMCVNVHG